MQVTDSVQYYGSANSVNRPTAIDKSVSAQTALIDGAKPNAISVFGLKPIISDRINIFRSPLFGSVINPLNVIFNQPARFSLFSSNTYQHSTLRSQLQSTITLKQLYDPELGRQLLKYQTQLRQQQIPETITQALISMDHELKHDNTATSTATNAKSTISSLSATPSLPTVIDQRGLEQYRQKEKQFNRKPIENFLNYQPYEKPKPADEQKHPQLVYSENFFNRLVRWSLNLIRLCIGK